MIDGESYRPPSAEESTESAGLGGFNQQLTEEELAEKGRQGRLRTMNLYLSPIGDQPYFRKERLTAGDFAKLPDRVRLLLSVGMLSDSRYSSLYDDEFKKREFLLRMMNKGKKDKRRKQQPEPMGAEELEDMLAEEVEEGTVIPPEDGGIELTEEGLAHIHDSMDTSWRGR